MRLHVLRHAIAVDGGTPGYEDDSTRPLTEPGVKKMRRAAQGLARLDLDVDLILTSPYRRARETAEIAARALDAEERLEVLDALAAPVAVADAVRGVAERSGNAESVMIVGHEPQLSGIGSILLAGHEDLDLLLKKGGLFTLACRQIAPGEATLEAWLPPGVLRALGA
jgi:phosphohistidine phosphatase